ncbi:PLP-dependent transferase [Aspergillus ruber CBS 135680]|uniref:PLP-dependent transferase n=1 Tax=Aspergillus ruber (strain CBS 135680) TaxID=1388766 RepID=A0A017S639_ASPRC|nr:PLP-dependent transferase [Aspergillus ruber CBS 135680]EYE91610.1 PLP-dependent transferase [Aspergillus ruber CBS 135680]
MFENVQQGPVDPMFVLKRDADNDVSPGKVDLGVGIYRNTEGKYHEMGVLREYESTTGNPAFLKDAAAAMFGEECEALNDGRVTSVQTISGTGANHLAALFLARCAGSKQNTVYVGTPTWGNYEPLCSLVGLQVVKYRYYNPETATVDFTTLLNTVSSAPPNSIFILQGCCHNPTGADLTPSQWDTLAGAMKQANVFPFLDIAYQGLGGSMNEDAYPIRLFTELGFEMAVCQSFSKNLGLYGERCGVLHVVNSDAAIASRVYDQLRCLIRWEFSSSPAYGSRLASIAMGSDLKGQW